MMFSVSLIMFTVGPWSRLVRRRVRRDVLKWFSSVCDRLSLSLWIR